MGSICRIYERNEKFIQNSWSGYVKGISYLEILGEDERIILSWILARDGVTVDGVWVGNRVY
jgi:hypothetical protein